MLGAEVAEHIGNHTVSDWLRNVSSAWKEADLVIGNLECPCVTRSRPVVGPLPEIIFHAPSTRLAELAACGFSAVTLANNHIMNCGPEGLVETIEGLRSVGLYYAGAGMNIDGALAPAFIPVRGITVGLAAFCYGPPAGRTSPGAAPHEFKTMLKGLQMARKHADLVIAALHDGLEYSDVPPTETRARFRFLAENGADLVIGHHPHVLQGLEWIGKVPVAYSLGDLLFHNSLPHVAKRNFARMEMALYASDEIQRDPDKFSRGAVLTVHVSGRTKSVCWHPFRQGADLRPYLCTDQVQVEDVRRLSDLSAALLTKNDYRHDLADSVMKSARRKNLAQLRIQDLLKLARRPKWRYFSSGLNWLWQKIRCRQYKARSLIREPQGR